MPELTWIGKEKVINHHLDVPFKILEKKYTYPNLAVSPFGGGKGEENITSSNAIIHGDNLEALKALLPEYENQVKCIYIDPPYNTGNENWVYNDNVNDEKIRKWLGKVVGKEDLNRSDRWLCMMYPRLVLLRKLLAQDGAIFISIDDNEQANLKLICDEIFGGNNFVTTITWQKKISPSNDAKWFSSDHEYILVYAKNKNLWFPFRFALNDKQKDYYRNPDNDPRGVWNSSTYTCNKTIEERPNLYYPIINPNTREEIYPKKTAVWAYSQEVNKIHIQENLIFWGNDGKSKMPRFKKFLSDNKGVVPRTIWFYEDSGHTQEATQELRKFVEQEIFNTPKPSRLIQRILQLSTDKDSIVLDSFAGSGTTAHAVLNLNRQDGGNRKFILIECEDYAESITAERVRRVISPTVAMVAPNPSPEERRTDTLDFGDARNSTSQRSGISENLGFSFYELGEPLLDENNDINPQASTEAIRKYIWYTETANVNPMLPEGYLLGIEAQTAYYFYYEKAEVTTLDIDFLATVPAEMAGMSFVIYADMCLLSQAFLEKNRIVFKKIPRDISKL